MPNTNCDMRRVQRRKSRKAAYFQISPPKISLKPLQNTKIPCLYLGSSSSSWWKLQFWALYLPYWASSKPDPSRALKMMVFGPRTPTPSVQVISGLKSWWNQERIHVAMTSFAAKDGLAAVSWFPIFVTRLKVSKSEKVTSHSYHPYPSQVDLCFSWFPFLSISNITEINPKKENQVFPRCHQWYFLYSHVFTSYFQVSHCSLSMLGLL